MPLQWRCYARFLPPDNLPARSVKRFGVILLVVLIAAGLYRTSADEETATGSLTLPGPAPNVGEEAETFEAQRHDGGSFELSDDGVYVLTFWNVYNKDTAEARPALEGLAREYGDEGATFAAVYVCGVPRGEMEAAVPYAVLQDCSGELASLYNVKRVPRTFLIRDGRIELVQNGFLPENERSLEEELARVLEERAEGSEQKRRRA